MKSILTFLSLFVLLISLVSCYDEDEIPAGVIRIDYAGASSQMVPGLRVIPFPGTSYKMVPRDGGNGSCLQLKGDDPRFISIVDAKGDLIPEGKGALLSMWIRGASAYDSSGVHLSVQMTGEAGGKDLKIVARGRLSGTTRVRLSAWYYRRDGSAAPKAILLEVPDKTGVVLDDVLMTYSPEKLPADPRPVIRVQEDRIMAGDHQIILQGINLSAYSSDDKFDYNRELTANREGDYRDIAAAGFNVVRLNLWYRALMADGGWEWLNIQRLWAQRHGLRLILDLHAPPGGYQSPVYEGGFWKDTPQARLWQEQTIQFWQEIARRYKNDPAIAAIDLINEPKPGRDGQWWDFVRRTVKRIHAEGFDQPVIAEKSFAPDAGYELLEDKGIIYDCHFYDPWPFASGQGGKYNTACLPGEPGVVLNRDWLLKDLKDEALDFARENKVPLNVGEYGIAWEALKNGGLLWLQDLTDILDEYRISRQYWCWHTYQDFSIERSGRYRKDPPVVNDRVLSIISVKNKRIKKVARTKGLVAFWDFEHEKDGAWSSYYDSLTVNRSFPVFIRRIGDTVSYTPENWPYDDADSRLLTDQSGPFGQAVRFNRGYIFGEVPRRLFDATPLDLHGHKPFTIIAWLKFTGQRHMVAGIWDEGGWNKYSGRRQAALFGGLFDEQGVIAHISATGAASFPQSEVKGAQYARQRAIDGQPFENGRWVAMAMTCDPDKKRVTAFLNGIMTPKYKTDPVARDVFRYQKEISANPFHFKWPVYSPRHFILKYNGYNVETSGVYERWLEADLDQKRIVYGMDHPGHTRIKNKYRITLDIRRRGISLLSHLLQFRAVQGEDVALPVSGSIQPGDVLITSLEEKTGGRWNRVGTEVQYAVSEGAPFTFGRALGLGSEALNEGTQLYIDGVAVFDRVLKGEELKALSFGGL